ncbi:MAG: hypothetical protein CMB64_05020 [Euryarchaeota archaeon]|nr:hypothetical protein [Euryarchaeota archaeon]
MSSFLSRKYEDFRRFLKTKRARYILLGIVIIASLAVSAWFFWMSSDPPDLPTTDNQGSQSLSAEELAEEERLADERAAEAVAWAEKFREESNQPSQQQAQQAPTETQRAQTPATQGTQVSDELRQLFDEQNEQRSEGGLAPLGEETLDAYMNLECNGSQCCSEFVDVILDDPDWTDSPGENLLLDALSFKVFQHTGAVNDDERTSFLCSNPDCFLAMCLYMKQVGAEGMKKDVAMECDRRYLEIFMQYNGCGKTDLSGWSGLTSRGLDS